MRSGIDVSQRSDPPSGGTQRGLLVPLAPPNYIACSRCFCARWQLNAPARRLASTLFGTAASRAQASLPASLSGVSRTPWAARHHSAPERAEASSRPLTSCTPSTRARSASGVQTPGAYNRPKRESHSAPARADPLGTFAIGTSWATRGTCWRAQKCDSRHVLACDSRHVLACDCCGGSDRSHRPPNQIPRAP